MLTNPAISAVIALVGFAVGYAEFAMVQVPITMVAASIGVLLFFVQHQFEATSWDEAEDWDFHRAAVAGSSHYELPAVLRWFTANTGVHHVHRLRSRIPNYRLQDSLKRAPELRRINRITFLESLKCVPLTLRHEERRRLVGFASLAGCRAVLRGFADSEWPPLRSCLTAAHPLPDLGRLRKMT